MVHNRQRTDAFAGQGEDCIAHRRRDRRRSGLAHAAPLVAAAERKMNIDFRRLSEPDHRVGIKIALLRSSVFDGDLAVESGRQGKDGAALHLLGQR